MNYLFDVGSSTIKFYKQDDKLTLINKNTFNFKEGFTADSGLSSINTHALLDYFKNKTNEYKLSKSNTKIFATGIFREIRDRQLFVENFYAQTGLYFNIISQALEAFFLEKAWTNAYSISAGLLVLNIGGKTTELLIYSNGNLVQKELLEIGVGNILKRFPIINSDDLSISDLKPISEYIKNQLKSINCIIDNAIYTGGELDYMKRCQYPLRDNSIFQDDKHPCMITTKAYSEYNKKIFQEFSLNDLRNLMPENPSWMDGARACSIIAQTICRAYNIENIIPSNSNLIDGVVVQEARSVVVCGSFNRHLNEISKLIDTLKKRNICILSPISTEKIGEEKGFVLFKHDHLINHCTWTVESLHLKAIEKCDFVIACNYDNYIGFSTAFEIGYAYKCGKKVVFVENNDVVNSFDGPCEIGLL